MQFFDILLENEDITVLGGPESIELSVDVGEKGDRGSRFFVGYGDPNEPDVIPSGEQVALGDVFVNASTAARYGWLYIYLRTPSGNAWVQTLRLQPSLYIRDADILFDANGEGTLSVPLSDIVADTTVLDIDKYIVLLNPSGDDFVLVTITQKFIQGSNFVAQMKALEYDTLTTNWIDFTGILRISVSISVV